jgi:glucan phosphoethanolaminetransferase (alkaline phosphatase superfamily)
MKKRSIGLKAIIVISFIAAFFYLATSLVAFFYKDFLYNLPNFQLDLNFRAISIIIGVVLLLLSIVYLLIGIGLIKRKNSARVAFIVLSFINILGSVISIIEGNYISVGNLVFHGLVGGYMLLSRKVREEFTGYRKEMGINELEEEDLLKKNIREEVRGSKSVKKTK